MRYGIDLGGTKIEIAAICEENRIRLRRRVATPCDYQQALDALAELLSRAEVELGQRAVALGVGMPGSLSPLTGQVRNANSTWLNGRRLDRDLACHLHRPVRVANDANCFALAEALAGAGRGATTVFGVILGTGIGGGLVFDGRLVEGRNGIGGEWGHNPLPGPTEDERTGPACYCGRNGCIETWCSGPGLAADHLRTMGRTHDPAGIAELALAGDEAAQATLARHLDRLGRALAGVVNLLDPDVIVLGGGLSKFDHLVRDLPDAMRPHIFSDNFDSPVVLNALGDSAGVIGAAWLWRPDEIAQENA